MRGFTLVEVIVSMAIYIILITLSLNFFYSRSIAADFDNTWAELSQTIRYAQSLAMASEGNSAYGVKLEETSYILFRGTSFGTREEAYDVVYQLPSFLSLSGMSEVRFSKWTGDAEQTGSFALLNTDTEQQRQASVNEEGIIE